ncbi:hypothetical protein [Neobacillus massiliamazoniensis]|jgi:PHP family Zn ribbon phosphoesterase|uniref:Uncharacterized protein n=1 Tax=Neobacillus massiliamazoniensis TaxID=1499688 RepID=A0A0U1NZA9_9BACI|nr:hypothetical protein [Neobacillus massiliamazoniensis]CRK83316.1 hypothetical protein BN000_03280 [Neobacillus massiliamazoniensis]
MLNELDIKILIALYQMHLTYGNKLNFSELGFENYQHVAYHLNKLRNLDYIHFNENDVYHTGELNHEKYKNNVVMIWFEKIEIAFKGIEEVEKHFVNIT